MELLDVEAVLSSVQLSPTSKSLFLPSYTGGFTSTLLIMNYPAWHLFEQIIRSALKPVLPRGDFGGILLNRWLDDERSAEADLLYAGSIEGKQAAVIVECKNRPIEVDGSRIHLPGGYDEVPIDLMASLSRKSIAAQSNLGFDIVKILVVGVTSKEILEIVNPHLLVAGQPIEKWVKGTNKEQSFDPLLKAWAEVTRDFVPLSRKSDRFNVLRALPRLEPRGSQEENPTFDFGVDHSPYQIFAEAQEQNRLLNQSEGHIEEGWYYPDET